MMPKSTGEFILALIAVFLIFNLIGMLAYRMSNG